MGVKGKGLPKVRKSGLGSRKRGGTKGVKTPVRMTGARKG